MSEQDHAGHAQEQAMNDQDDTITSEPQQTLTNALDLSLADWHKALAALGEPSYRAGQVFSALHAGKDIQDIGNVPRALREKLAKRYTAQGVRIVEKFTSSLDGTVKYVFGLAGGHLIEGVRMRYHHGDTLCISTQVGCKMNCAFCASALDGCARNLTAGEMLGQIVSANRDDSGIHNVVLMGSGEPLDNYDSVIAFLRLLREESGVSISMRSVSLSTCGIVPNILQLAGEGLPVTLCISLHAPNDAVRRRLMPVAAVYDMEALLAACRVYVQKVGRRIIFEYALADGINSEPAHARELSTRLRGLQCHVNLIALNPVPEKGLRAATGAQITEFLRVLTANHISATKRREMGRDISGACGQLRRRVMQNIHEEG